jgi:hypothetical protein
MPPGGNIIMYNINININTCNTSTYIKSSP